MTTTADFHKRAMELFDSALLLARQGGELDRSLELLKEALKIEMVAADSVVSAYHLEPTRSVLYRSAASIALRINDLRTAKRYVEEGLRGTAPPEIREELIELNEQILTLEAEMRDYRLKGPVGLTRVQKIIRSFQGRAPVDIMGLARALGTAVREAELGSNGGEIFRDLLKGGFSGYSILVNSADTPQQKRFTIAHELAHFLKHRDRIRNRLIEDRMYMSGLGKTKEDEANALAADLLIPQRLVGRLRKDETLSVEQLAARFDVPLQMMKRRIGDKS